MAIDLESIYVQERAVRVMRRLTEDLAAGMREEWARRDGRDDGGGGERAHGEEMSGWCA